MSVGLAVVRATAANVQFLCSVCMAVDVLHALPLIGKPKPTKFTKPAILAIIFALRDWCDCDPTRTSKIRDGGSRRVDDGNRTVHISGKDPCFV